MGKSYSEKIRKRSRPARPSRSRNRETTPFPFAPVIVLGVVLLLIAAGILMYSFDRNKDDNGGTIFNDEGDSRDSNGKTIDPGSSPIILDTTDGGSLYLEQYRGKVVILDMMATWCNPCRLQMAELEELESMYSPSDMMILSIGADLSESMDLLRDFKEEEGADWPFAMSNTRFNSQFPATSIPTIYILDRNGNLANSFVGVTESVILAPEVDSLIRS